MTTKCPKCGGEATQAILCNDCIMSLSLRLSANQTTEANPVSEKSIQSRMIDTIDKLYQIVQALEERVKVTENALMQLLKAIQEVGEKK